MRDKESNDLNSIYRVYLSRANILMPLLRLMRSRATELFKWAMMKFIAKPNSTASVDSQGVGSGDSLCALRVGAALDRSRYNKNLKERSSFYFNLSKRLSKPKFDRQKNKPKHTEIIFCNNMKVYYAIKE